MTGRFQKWYRAGMGKIWQSKLRTAADLVEASDLDYVILRITWLYNQAGNTAVHVTRKGEPFTEAQVTTTSGIPICDGFTDGQSRLSSREFGLGRTGYGTTRNQAFIDLKRPKRSRRKNESKKAGTHPGAGSSCLFLVRIIFLIKLRG